MKLLRASPDQFVFRLGQRERQLLYDTLQLYPVVPPAHHRIAAADPLADEGEAQRLLDEAMAEHRSENRRQILALFQDPAQVRQTARGIDLTLAPAQIEWLLQVLNDIRVGSWLALGKPEEDQFPRLKSGDAVYWVALEVCGIYQSVLLSALGADQSPAWQ